MSPKSLIPIDRFVSIVLPMKDAELYIEQYVDDLLEIMTSGFTDFEIVMVDDHSRDYTVTVVDQMLKSHANLRCIQLSSPRGIEIATSVGLENVIGDYTIVLDPETDPPKLVKPLVMRATQGADIIYGIDHSREGRSLPQRVVGSLLHSYLRRYAGIDVPPNLTHLRCFSRRAISALSKFDDPHVFYKYSACIIGFSNDVLRYAPLRSSKRRDSVPKLISRYAQIMVDNSPHPLRIVTVVGLLIALGNLAYMGYIAAIYVFKPNVAEGWSTMSMQVSVLAMAMILILTGISEYVGRILRKTQNKPHYFVSTEKVSAVGAGIVRLNVVEDSKATESPKKGR